MQRMYLRGIAMVLAGVLACGAAGAATEAPAAVPARGDAAPAVVVTLPAQGGIALRAHWFAVATQAGAPVVVGLHGCGGLYAGGGRLGQRYREAGERLQAAGIALLLPDSLGPRGIRSLCATRYGERTVDPAQRVQDTLAAIAWVRAQPGLAAAPIGVLGWSNGGTTALQLLERLHGDPAAARIAGVAVFYPGCAAQLRRHARAASVPLLMQLGDLDDWTPAQPCADLARQWQAAPGADITVHRYADSYHGFDGTAPVRLRTEVPNGVSPRGVHQGGNAQARRESLAELDRFWQRVLLARTPEEVR